MIYVHYLPIYWGVETDPPDRSLVTRATLHETLPPFRRSTWAFRIRVSHRHWLHMGRFGYQRDIGRWGMTAGPGEISKWGQDAAQEDDYDDSALLALRPVQPVGPDRPPRIYDDEERGTLQGAESFGTGFDLGAESAGDTHGAAAGCDQSFAAEG